MRSGRHVGRLGGDEFVVLVESAARGVRLDSLARRVIEALHKPVELDGFGPSFFLTASIGVAFGRYATPDDLLRDAQLALTAAKAAGKDRYTLFNANMRSVIEGRGGARGRAEHRAAGEAVLPALPADLRPAHPQGGGPRGAHPLAAPTQGVLRPRRTSSRSPRKPG